jgi:hypothetical protein
MLKFDLAKSIVDPEKMIRPNEVEMMFEDMTENAFRIGDMDKINMLVVSLGLKSAGCVGAYFDAADDVAYQELVAEIEEVTAILKKLGLVFVLVHSPDDGDGLDGIVLFYGKTSRDLERLLAVRRSNDLQFGRAVGFPDSAIEAFVQDRERKCFRGEKFWPAEVKSSVYAKYQPFLLSRAHWREELKLIESWVEAFKQKAPYLYAKIFGKK